MKKTATLVLASVLLLCLSSPAWAQAWPQEDHFKVYTLTQPYTYVGQIGLVDQFTDVVITDAVLEKIATPTVKNGEPWLDPVRHQTWWRIVQQMPTWKFDVQNQFGLATWYSHDAAYLVLPALKNQPGEIPVTNHYKCYDASGPPVNFEVVLEDQFDTVTVVVAEPVVFCNPVEKVDEQGFVYPIENPDAHLACYRIDPRFYGLTATMYDQFGTWTVELGDQDWLCVPSYKIDPTGTKESTWGLIKQRYRE